VLRDHPKFQPGTPHDISGCKVFRRRIHFSGVGRSADRICGSPGTTERRPTPVRRYVHEPDYFRPLPFHDDDKTGGPAE
jgi:hypothetical protein